MVKLLFWVRVRAVVGLGLVLGLGLRIKLQLHVSPMKTNMCKIRGRLHAVPCTGDFLVTDIV